MYHSIYEGKLFNIEGRVQNSVNRKQEIDMFKKRADKGAFTCPHCEAPLILKSGDIRGVFFAHSSGQACTLTQSYDTYKKQTARESKQHSVMREIIHEVLKNQENIREDLKVDFGYIAKAEEKWSHLPDIVLKTKETELAISILTNVDRSKDSKLTKQIKKRNDYFSRKGLQTLWFIENQELSLDFENHVLHLWESEIDLSIKTKEDSEWDEVLKGLNSNTADILDTFGYWRKNSNINIDTRSLYYVYSTQEGIDFSVHRFIVDELQFPHRAFSLTRGYKMSISTALSFNNKLALHDSELEKKDRTEFLEEFHSRKEKKEEEKKALLESQKTITFPLKQDIKNIVVKQAPIAKQQVAATSTYTDESPQTHTKMSYTELKNKLKAQLGMTQKQQLHLWHNIVLKRGIMDFDQLWLVAQHLENFEQFEQAINEYLNS